MPERRVLVAGIGNVFLGDDGFGVEVAQRLARAPQPDGVEVGDFGIRGFDLAFALLDDPEATILVDAMPRGEAPGTLYVLDPDLETAGDAGGADHAQGSFQGHAMTPAAVFGLTRALGGRPPRNVVIVGCEPQTFGPENEGYMGLSPAVEAAVPEAVALVERLVRDRLAGDPAAATRPAGEEHG